MSKKAPGSLIFSLLFSMVPQGSCKRIKCGVSHVDNEKRAPGGCLGYIGDEILHRYVGIIINHMGYIGYITGCLGDLLWIILHSYVGIIS